MRFSSLIIYFIYLIPISNCQYEPILSIPINDGAARIYSVDISNDGKLIATGTHSVKLWDVETGEEQFEFNEHGVVTIRNITFSKDDYLIASGDGLFNAIVWARETGEVIQKFRGYDRDPLGEGIKVALTPDNKKLITGSNSTLQLWDVSSGEELLRYPDYGRVGSVLIHPNGNELFLESGGVVLFEIETGEIERIFVNLTRQSISNDGNTILGITQSGSDGYTIEIQDTNSGSILKSVNIDGKTYPNNNIISPNSKHFLISNYIVKNGKSIGLNRVLYDAITPGPIRTYETDENADPNSPFSTDSIIKFFPDGKKFLTVNGNTVHIWDISDVVTNVENAHLHNN